MSLKTQIAADVKTVFMNEDEFAATIRYYGDRGLDYTPSITFDALLDAVEDLQEEAEASVHTERVITIAAEDIPTNPAVGHELEVGGRLCRVREWTADGHGAIRLILFVGGPDPGP